MNQRPQDVFARVVAIVVASLTAIALAHSAPAAKPPGVPAPARAPAVAPAAASARETTTFNFVKMPVRAALTVIAEEGHFNLVLSDAVQGTITLHLDHATWKQALDVVLRLKGLSARVEGTTLWVGSAGH